MRPGRGGSIESPRARSTRRAAPGSFQAILLADAERFWATFYVCNRSIESYGQRRRGRTTRTVHDPGPVVEGIHLDLSAPSARQGSRPRAPEVRRGGVPGGTEATIESPRARGPRRATRGF